MIYKKRVVIVNDNDLSNDINSAQEAADSAILEQQRIYYRSKEGRIPYGAADPTDIWITNHDDRYNELSNENAATAWSTKITPIARGIDSNENEDKYLYLYTCVQKRIVSKDAVNYTLSLDTTVNASKLYYERSGMTDNYVYTVISNPSGNPHENQYYEQSPKVPHTEILLDETTTVIDGGKIITGSVMANRLNAASINAWHQLSIGAFDANTTKAISNSTYITFIDTQTGIRVHSVEDENNYVQINATDIRLIRANTPRMILGATNFGFSDENGTQRLLLNATDGAIIGYTNNIYTQIKNEGFYIYNGASNQTNKKLTQITSSGLEIFDSVDGSSVAEYGSSINLASNEATVTIGNTNKYHTVLTNSGMYFKNGANTTSQNLLTITGNEIKLYKSNTTTAAVTINSSGKLTANNVDLTGKITADDGQIGPWFINNTSISKNSNGTAVGSYDTASNMYFGDSGLSIGTTFKVTNAGYITATSGQIGGWTITSGKIYAGDGSTVKTAVMQAPSSSITWVFAAGGSSHDSYSDCPFRVDKTGTLYATGATISGEITATKGTIGGCSISNGVLQIAAANITSGTIASARIPNLDASKITTGTLSASRIAVSEINIGAAQITSGTIASARIPNLDASKITTGTLSASRIDVSSITTIGPSDGKHLYLSSSGLYIYKDASNCSISLTDNGYTRYLSILRSNDTAGLALGIQYSSDYWANLQVNSSFTITANGGITLRTKDNTTEIYLAANTNSGYLRSAADGDCYLGSENYCFKGLYLTNKGNVYTSDKKEKDVLGPITFAKELILGLHPIQYMWKKGDHRRKRMGFIAQEAAETCNNLNENLAFVTASYKSNDDEVLNPYYGEKVDDDLLTWGISYEQLIAPLIQVVQEQQKEIEQLKEHIEILEEK